MSYTLKFSLTPYRCVRTGTENIFWEGYMPHDDLEVALSDEDFSVNVARTTCNETVKKLKAS